MTNASAAAAFPSFSDIPADWRSEAQTQLRPLENVQAVLEVDLDTKLRFVRGLVLATDQRLFSRVPGAAAWRSWDYRAGLEIIHHDHAGVGHLELVDGQDLLASWRFTLAQNLPAIRLVEQFRRYQASSASGLPVVQLESHYCPVCKAPLEPEQSECLICTQVIHTPPSTWTLFRLWRFAKPYQGQLFLGFALTLLGTAASLVPPYLTMPLMDDVLIPLEQGQKVDPMLVAIYLTGLFGAALLAWGLTWAKTYVLALVSERIGSDLPTTP